MEKIRTPKFLIRAVGPFMDVEIPVYRGAGIMQLRRLKRIHNASFDRKGSAVTQKLIVQIIHPQKG